MTSTIYLLLHVGIKLLPIVKKRDRPKGHNSTVIGLPSKQQNLNVLVSSTTLKSKKVFFINIYKLILAFNL